MPTIKVDNLSMYYEVHGKGEPVVFIPGFSVDHTIWGELIEPFKKNYQVILLDNRGSGQTAIPDGPYSIDTMAKDVAGLCANLDIARAHFVGNSMGGFILQALAYKYPSLVKSATISNSSMTIETPFHIYVAAQLELLKANAPLSSLIKASCSWAYSFQFLSKPGVLDALVQIGLANPYPMTIKGYEGQYAALEAFNSQSWANRIQVPTLVLTSDQDLIISPRLAKLLADHIPSANYHCFSDCGHLPLVEYPEVFAKVVQQFISGV